jgi:hypothetical protein
MSWFLKTKHWVLFVLATAVPFVIYAALIVTLITTQNISMLFVCAFLMMAIILYVHFGWLYNVGINLHKLLPPEAGMNGRRFRIFFMIPLCYIICLSLFMVSIGIAAISKVSLPPTLAFSFILIIPLHFFSIFCIFHTMWFVAKCLKIVELWKPVSFGDYFVDFICIWFWPIGIWFLQPRINRIFDKSLQNTAGNSPQG